MADRTTVYLDHAASTPVLEAVRAEMRARGADADGNPSAVHAVGRRARAALEDARSRVAAAIGGRPEEVVFTAGGTEANNLALRGAVLHALSLLGVAHVVTTGVEHSSVSRTVAELAAMPGVEATEVPVDRHGRVAAEAVLAAVRPDTALVSVQLANSEVGTLQPVAEIGAALRERSVPLHTDAVQAARWLRLDADALGASLVSLSGHKLGAPKGIGALYVREGTRLFRALSGGPQERGLRPGTENVVGAVGLAAALEIAIGERAAAAARVGRLADLLRHALGGVPGVRLTGDPRHRLPSIVSLAVPGVRADALLLGLDMAGICASSGSACRAGSAEPSRVLLAMGLDPDTARGALRFSLGPGTREAEIARVLAVLPGLVLRLRAAGR